MKLLCYLLVMNVLTFALYWLDKRAARNGSWRIPEANLLLFGFLGGTLGAVMAQQKFRHKTRKGSFQFKFWALTVLQIILLVVQPAPVRVLIAHLLA
jgi:uncharacterized membrane protein YsdA (DUF1294 family)